MTCYSRLEHCIAQAGTKSGACCGGRWHYLLCNSLLQYSLFLATLHELHLHKAAAERWLRFGILLHLALGHRKLKQVHNTVRQRVRISLTGSVVLLVTC